MKITPIKALNDNYIWMIQEGNHAACVDPSDATPVLKFLVHNRLMLAQTWITHPHPDHTGGAKSLFHGFLESPIYGESDIDVATHDRHRRYAVPVWRRLGYRLGNPRPYRPPHQLSAGKFRRPACFLRRYLVLRRLRPRIYRHNRAALRQFPPLQPTARRNAVFIRRTNIQPPTCALPCISSRTMPTFRQPWPQPNTRRHCQSALRTNAKSIRFSAYICPKFRHAPKN